MDQRRAILCLLLIVAVVSIVAGKVQYKKRHYHYQKLYTFPAKPVQVHNAAKVAVYSKKGSIPVQVPTYEFGYKIHDPKHKNFQEKTEKRLGDAVEGYYSLLQPNGEIRVVRYKSDDTGFHSKVTLHQHENRATRSRFS